MEEPHKTHKEPAWGWAGVLLSALRDASGQKPVTEVVTNATRRRADCASGPSTVAPQRRRTA